MQMNTTAVSTQVSGRKALDTNTISEMERRFRDFAESRLFGQPEAVNAMCRAFRRAMNPFRNAGAKKRKPIYVVVNAGESRTGKTYFAELLAEFFHGDPEALLFINGSDYIERHYLVNLIGAARTYIGYTDPKDPKYVAPQADEKDTYAELSTHNLKWSRKGSDSPITIILVDEWEKACKEFNRVFLRIMDKAKGTLGNGEEVDYSMCIIVLTTNLGMGEVEDEKNKNPLGFNQSKKSVSHADVEGIIAKHMKDFAPPEFRNRVKENGEVVVFRSLSEADKYRILDRDVLEVQNLFMSEPTLMFTVSVDQAARKFIMDEALKDDGTVSNLKAIIQNLLEEPLAGEAIKRTIGLGDRIEVTHEEGKDGLTYFHTKDGALLIGTQKADAGEQPQNAGNGTGASDGSAETPAPIASDRSVAIPARRSFAIVPGVPLAGGGVMIDMSELMFLVRAHELKTMAQQRETLMVPYTIRMTNKDSLDALTVRCLEMVRELHEILGVKVLRSETSYQSPFTVTLKVLALPGQIDLLSLRYAGISITLDDTK
jgi:hypothetical protein